MFSITYVTISYQVFAVLDIGTRPEGSVWEIGSQTDGWKTLIEGDIISGDNFVRLNISSSADSGVAYFGIKEKSGNAFNIFENI